MYQQQKILFNNKPKRVIYAISNQTNEFGYAMAKTIPIKYEINEFSSFFKTKNSYEEKFLASLLTAYDGVFEKRNIKSEDSEESLEGIGVNTTIFTDYSDFEGTMLSELLQYLKKGFLRRFIITFTDTKHKLFSDISLNEAERINDELESIGNKIFNTFQEIIPNSEYILLEEAYNVYQQYRAELCDYENELDDNLLKIEVGSRAYKALLLSGIYAPLNHPTILTVTKEDMLQAISSVEFLSQEFSRFLIYKPEHTDVHDNILNFLKENLEKDFNKGYFTSNSRTFGVPREKMAKNFDSYMETVGYMAESSGYVLKTGRNKQNNGNVYTLQKVEEQPLSSEVLDIVDIIPISGYSKPDNTAETFEMTGSNNLPNITNFTDDEINLEGDASV